MEALVTTPSQRENFRAFSYWTLAWLSVCLVFYGSLVPFEFKVPPVPESLSGKLQFFLQVISSPRWVQASSTQFSSLGLSGNLSDTLVNLFLYVPAAVFLRLDLRRRNLYAGEEIIAVMLLLGCVSWILECTQSLEAARTASLRDVILNTGGAAVAAIIAPWARDVSRRVVFQAYCKISILVIDAAALVQKLRAKSSVSIAALIGVNTVVLALWAVAVLHAQTTGKTGKFHAVPFLAHFHKTYDEAAMLMAKSMVIYALMAVPVALLWASVRTTQGWLRVMLATAAMAGGLQAIRSTVAGRSSDITEPILALVAAGTLLLGSHLAHRAVQACCRRKQSAPVAVERRRRDHRYGSAADRKPQPTAATPAVSAVPPTDAIQV
jgi:glycopeptide antibiotics resistance protein